MALDRIDAYDGLSSSKKGTGVILGKLKNELSPEGLNFYLKWAEKYKSETDIVVALGNWEEEATVILAEVSVNTQRLIGDFIKRWVGYTLKMKEIKSKSNNGDSL